MDTVLDPLPNASEGMEASAKADPFVRALTRDQPSEEQLMAATVAWAPLELLRIRAVRTELMGKGRLGVGQPGAAAAVATLDRCERFAHTKRRRASRKLSG